MIEMMPHIRWNDDNAAESGDLLHPVTLPDECMGDVLFSYWELLHDYPRVFLPELGALVSVCVVLVILFLLFLCCAYVVACCVCVCVCVLRVVLCSCVRGGPFVRILLRLSGCTHPAIRHPVCLPPCLRQRSRWQLNDLS